MAAMESSAEITTYSVYSSVTISDCNRQVTLDFSSYQAKDYDVKIEKLRFIMDELFKLEQFLLDNKDKFVKNLKATKEKLEKVQIV